MPEPQQVDALILAAGEGKRLGLGPKALLTLNGHTLVEHVAHLARPFVQRVVVGTCAPLVDRFQTLLPWTTVVPGGGSRQETLAILLSQTTAPYILVLDAARPFTPSALVQKLLQAVTQRGIAIPFLNASVPHALFDGGPSTTASIPSGRLLLTQGPQAFSRPVLCQAYALADQKGWHFQSTLELLHAANFEVTIVPGIEENIKITTDLDWKIAQKILQGSLPALP